MDIINVRTYKNLSGNSSITHYWYNSDRIVVFFSNGSAYMYELGNISESDLVYMIECAEAGEGLNSYIMRRCRRQGVKIR